MMDMRPRWTISKHPPHLPRDDRLPWAVYELAARLHGAPVMHRFATCRKAKRWALRNAPNDTEVVLITRLKPGL